MYAQCTTPQSGQTPLHRAIPRPDKGPLWNDPLLEIPKEHTELRAAAKMLVWLGASLEALDDVRLSVSFQSDDCMMHCKGL